MTQSPPIYPDWKAPAQDGEVLIWPDPRTLIAQTRANHAALSAADDVLIQNTPLPDLRRSMRKFIGHDDRWPLVACGHQTELYHSGVWVKDVLINRAASAIDGHAFHFAVDTDGPKHLHIRWPNFSSPISDDPAIATAAWSARVTPPTPKHLQDIENAALGTSTFDSASPLIQFLKTMRKLSLEPDELPAMLTNALHELDWSMGLRHHALTTSGLLVAEPYLAFVHHIMARAESFAQTYNAALASYRQGARIRTANRPMPDLFVSDQSIESPFWLDDLASGTRIRPSVFRCADGWMLQLMSGEEFCFDADVDGESAAHALRTFLTRVNHRLAPRALTLTMFLRLLVADQFVHGIGGGRYDQVTDRIIASHFGMVPPGFAVTTATLFYPGATEHERVCMPCILHQGHQLRHAVLGSRKVDFVNRIEALERGSPARAEAFLAMHDERRAALATSNEIKTWQKSLHYASAKLADEEVLFDRELFYAVQTRERLESMIVRYDDAFAL